MSEYWIVCFSETRWRDQPLIAGPWYGWLAGKRRARKRLEGMQTDSNPLVTARPLRFMVKTVR